MRSNALQFWGWSPSQWSPLWMLSNTLKSTMSFTLTLDSLDGVTASSEGTDCTVNKRGFEMKWESQWVQPQRESAKSHTIFISVYCFIRFLYFILWMRYRLFVRIELIHCEEISTLSQSESVCSVAVSEYNVYRQMVCSLNPFWSPSRDKGVWSRYYSSIFPLNRFTLETLQWSVAEHKINNFLSKILLLSSKWQMTFQSRPSVLLKERECKIV